MIDGTVMLLLIFVAMLIYFKDSKTPEEVKLKAKQKKEDYEKGWNEILTADEGKEKKDKDKDKKGKKSKKQKKGQTDFEKKEKKTPAQTFTTTQGGRARFSTSSDGAAHLDYMMSDSDSEEEQAISKTQVKKQVRAKLEALSTQKATVAVLGKAAPSKPAEPKLEERTKVYAKYQDGDEYFRGIVTKVHRYGEYTIHYADGEIETKVPRRLIRTEPELLEELEQQDLEEEEYDEEAADFWEREEGWHEEPEWVSTAPKPKKSNPKPSANQVAQGGLTKKQRETRRKREKQREMRDSLRSQAQEGGLHKRWGGNTQKWSAN
jgi:hypothetical protein